MQLTQVERLQGMPIFGALREVEQFPLIQMNLGREVCRRLRATDELLFRFRMGDLPAMQPEVFPAG